MARTGLAWLLFVSETSGKRLGEQLAPPVSVSLVSKWVNGRQAIPDHRIRQIADVLRVRPDAIAEVDSLDAGRRALAIAELVDALSLTRGAQ